MGVPDIYDYFVCRPSFAQRFHVDSIEGNTVLATSQIEHGIRQS